MDGSTVNISFNKNLLKQIDETAKEESRTRSELIREAARLYIERKGKWAAIFKFAGEQAGDRDIRPEDVGSEIRSYRRKKK